MTIVGEAKKTQADLLTSPTQLDSDDEPAAQKRKVSRSRTGKGNLLQSRSGKASCSAQTMRALARVSPVPDQACPDFESSYKKLNC